MKNLAMLAASMLLIASHSPVSQAQNVEPVNSNEDLFLTIKQRLKLAMEAMHGSSEAATRIALFYGFVALNPVEQHRWTVIAAENGDPSAQYNAYQDFMNYGTDLDRERAMFWLKKAASSGDKMAQDELKHLKSK